eukprot:6100790-Karenia_brevis.AAC.1
MEIIVMKKLRVLSQLHQQRLGSGVERASTMSKKSPCSLTLRNVRSKVSMVMNGRPRMTLWNHFIRWNGAIARHVQSREKSERA